MEKISKWSDDYLFDEFRELFNKSRQFGLSKEDRNKLRSTCTEMNKRGFLRKTNKSPRSSPGSERCPPKAKVVRSSRTAGTK